MCPRLCECIAFAQHVYPLTCLRGSFVVIPNDTGMIDDLMRRAEDECSDKRRSAHLAEGLMGQDEARTGALRNR